jgi:LytS/YehU family sensor histidine kinase
MSSKWVDFVKDFASKKGMTYGEAMKNEECKKVYQLTKKDIKIEEIVETTKPKIAKPVKISKNPKLPKIPKEEVKVEEVVETPKAKRSSKKNKII